MHIREEWIKNTEFHPHSTADVLNEVVTRSEALLKLGKLPIVIFDLDSTLFDVSKRSYEILREWLAHPEARSHEEARVKLESVEITDMKYSLQDVWEKKKVPHDVEPYARHFKLAREYWRKRFFGNDYLKHDTPTEGAVDFVKRLYELGVKIVYLTGRDVPLMSFGTFDQLKEHGLPIETDRTRLILKPKRLMEDLNFKTQAAQTVMSWGEVVASFENEPKNLIAMSSAFGPNTMNVFIQTVSSDHAAPAGKGIYRIESFK